MDHGKFIDDLPIEHVEVSQLQSITVPVMTTIIYYKRYWIVIKMDDYDSWSNDELMERNGRYWIVLQLSTVYGGFLKRGVPQNGWIKIEIPIKMDDLGVPLF